MAIAAEIFTLLPGGPRFKKRLKYLYFRTCAMFGVVRSPALQNLDGQVAHYLPMRSGVFVEAGANDGISKSNTWMFERYRGWTGLLIEPVPWLAELAAEFRRAPVACVGLGARDGGVLELAESDLTTTADPRRFGADTRLLSVPVRSLSSLLDEHGLSRIDFFSLDVEGFELEVLKGLDLSRHRPAFILVETDVLDRVLETLQGRYSLEKRLSHHDYLLRWIEPEPG